jgi:tetratricopeptide (TPR) repeat protein
MDKESRGNIFPFPNLMERHMGMALEARDREDFLKAKEHLEQVLKIDSKHEPALLTLMVTYCDLGMYRSSTDLAEFMLAEELGDFSEVLQFYIISLIQLEEYRRACEILSTALSEHLLPPHKRKDFEEVFRTCSLLLENNGDDPEGSMLQAKVEEKLESDTNFMKKLITELDDGDFDRQLQAIEQLKYVNDLQVIRALRNYVIVPHADPVLKTMALRALKQLGEKGKILVYKFDQLFETSLEEVPGDQEGLKDEQRKVIELLARQSYHDDPVFVSFAMQIWIEYLFAAFPFIPPLQDTESWAAALHVAVANVLEQNISNTDIALKYGTTVQTMNKRLQSLQQVLNVLGRGTQSQYLPQEKD